MRIVLFSHSLRSDWNHGNAHFLRGVVTELVSRGHQVAAYEPRNAWSARNLAEGYGEPALESFRCAYPELPVRVYDPEHFDLRQSLHGADLALVHEWNEPELVAQVGQARKRHPELRALFLDTHHRSVTAPHEMSRYDLSNYDGVLAFGESVRAQYAEQKWGQAWTWHEAADTRVFYPRPQTGLAGDLVWIGNWGDDERSAELREFLIQPVRDLGLRARVYGVRYPAAAIEELRAAGIDYQGWLPNYRAPEIFGQFRMTIHVPRRPYAEALQGVPTIRVFEALACGIPLISAPWTDSENLFGDGSYLPVKNGAEARDAMRHLIAHPEQAKQMAEHGRAVIERRHTCSHRVDELLEIYRLVQPAVLAEVAG